MIVNNNLEKIASLLGRASTEKEVMDLLEYAAQSNLFNLEDMDIIKTIVNEKIIEISSKQFQ